MIEDIEKYLNTWIDKNPAFVAQAFSLFILGYGIYLIVASIKNWDDFKANLWFERDDTWQGISRIWGRKWARFKGFCTGLFLLVPLGAVLTYYTIIKPLLK